MIEYGAYKKQNLIDKNHRVDGTGLESYNSAMEK